MRMYSIIKLLKESKTKHVSIVLSKLDFHRVQVNVDKSLFYESDIEPFDHIVTAVGEKC